MTVARFGTVIVLRTCLALSVLLSVVVASPAAAAPASSQASISAPEHVLFIGNSHTRRHGGLDWLIGNFVAAEEAPHAYEGTMVADGGATLAHHWYAGVAQRIRSGDFDAVVLQGWLPGAPSATDEPFLEHAQNFEEVIDKTRARTILFMSWPGGPGAWPTLDDTVDAHRRLERGLGVAVAPAAVAFERSRAERPDIELIDADGIHATWEGAYLAAATVYATLFERSPEGLAYAFGVEPETAAYLQRVAWETLAAWREEGAR